MARRPSKLAVARCWLGRGSIRLHVDATAIGVQLPSYLQQDEHVVLEVGYDGPAPVKDLVLSRGGASGTLRFGGRPHFCRIPWGAVMAMQPGWDGQGVCEVWNEQWAHRQQVRSARRAQRVPRVAAEAKPALVACTTYQRLRLIQGGKS